MKIVDPIAIKEILENGVEIPLIITNMKSPKMITKIQRKKERNIIGNMNIVDLFYLSPQLHRHPSPYSPL